MDKSNKTWNYDQDKKPKKMVMKFGGGGIGAVVLLGGVLATAALASAFAARRKGRSSGKDRRSFHRNPPPEKDKMSEQDDTVSPVSTPGVNLNSVTDDGFVIVDEDFAHPEDRLPLESQNKISEDDQTEGYVSFDYSKEKENQEQVCVEEEPKQEENIGIIEVDGERESGDEERERGLKEDMEMKLERESGLHTQIGEIVVEDEAKLVEKQEKCEEKQRNETRGKIEEGEENVTIPHEKNKEENGNIYGITNEEAEFDEERESGLKEDIEVKLEKEEVEEFCSGDEEIMSEKKCVENDERESGQIEEIVQDDQEAWNDEKLVGKQKNCEEKKRNETRGKIEEREDNVTIPHENNKENGYLLHQTPDEITNDEAEFDTKKNVEKEVDVSPKTINEGIDKANGGTDLETSEEEEIVEESSLGSGDSSSESNSEVVWPAESAKPKLIDYEYEVGEHNDLTIIKEKTFIDKYYMGEMGMKKDHLTNLGRRRVAIATFSLLSSLSCSWFFDLSFANLCFVVFLTMLLSEIHGIATESSSARESHQAQN